VSDKQNGQGIDTYANGDKYDGNWVNGERSGKGTYTWADGRKYDGIFKEGRLYT